MVQQRDELEASKILTEQRLERAKKLIELTASEAIRWKETVARLGGEIENLFGDVFLSTASISYNGPFTGKTVCYLTLLTSPLTAGPFRATLN